VTPKTSVREEARTRGFAASAFAGYAFVEGWPARVTGRYRGCQPEMTGIARLVVEFIAGELPEPQRDHAYHHPHLDNYCPKQRPTEIDLDQTRVAKWASSVVLSVNATARTVLEHRTFQEVAGQGDRLSKGGYRCSQYPLEAVPQHPTHTPRKISTPHHTRFPHRSCHIVVCQWLMVPIKPSY